ncbi:zf-HC2 domain-containing protein [Fulvivirga lutea]|uniref:Zf-HC2 domain-containing protein n=1 Tax=Fulvivirga lutea TaxID=2810512 RepID=A0A974WGU5_9BACT|nr:zf-HC2 domain-containing protein [Fulvivirga lutea]QSE97815.1 zf-HC2 domain-containing protein [Fulvivirga lutea]
MDSNPTEKSSTNQPDHSECMKLLQLVLDDEATPTEREVFEKHVCNCMPYFEIYQVDKAIKSLVKKTCCGKDMPTDLANEIRAKLFQKAD